MTIADRQSILHKAAEFNTILFQSTDGSSKIWQDTKRLFPQYQVNCSSLKRRIIFRENLEKWLRRSL